jgi:hypothetical protein
MNEDAQVAAAARAGRQPKNPRQWLKEISEIDGHRPA